MDEITNIDYAFYFITDTFTVLTPKDLYLICQEYGINDDERELLKQKLEQEGGWNVEGQVWYD